MVGVYQHENVIYFANAGDSRGIVIGESTSQSPDAGEETQIMILAQTRDHKPDMADEAERIVTQYEG